MKLLIFVYALFLWGCSVGQETCDQILSQQYIVLKNSLSQEEVLIDEISAQRKEFTLTLKGCNVPGIKIPLLGQLSRLELILFSHDVTLLDDYIEQVGQEYVLAYQNSFGQSALHIAAGVGSTAAIEKLYKLGLEIDQEDMFGNTPLSSSIDGDQIGIENSELLMSLGARLDITSQGVLSLRQLAIENKKYELLNLLDANLGNKH